MSVSKSGSATPSIPVHVLCCWQHQEGSILAFLHRNSPLIPKPKQLTIGVPIPNSQAPLLARFLTLKFAQIVSVTLSLVC
jgi:hypothetical protein